MVYENSKKFKQQKQQKAVSEILNRGHVLVKGKYKNQRSTLVVFCKKHVCQHETTFINYMRSENGLPCCANESKKEKLRGRTFQQKTIEKMSQSAKNRPKTAEISCDNKKYWRRTRQYRCWAI